MAERGFLAEWLLLIAFPLCAPFVAADPLLSSGSELPPLQGTALSGESVALPRAAQGHPALLVAGFSKKAAEVTRPWLAKCRALPAEAGVICYDVRMLEEVPRFFRGMLERGMRKGLPVNLQHRTLLVYSDNDAWRRLVGADDDDSAYVIGCDKQGRVRATATGEIVDSQLQKLVAAIQRTPDGDPADAPAGSKDPSHH